MGGVQHSTLLLAEYLLINKSYDLNVLLPKQGRLADYFVKKSIPILFYDPVPFKSISISFFNNHYHILNPFSLLWNSIALLLNIEKVKFKIDPRTDLVITKGLLNHFVSGIACKNLKIPVIWHVQDLVTNRYFSLMRYLFNYFSKRIPYHIICDGEFIKKSLKKEIQDKSTVVLNGIKTETLSRDKEAGIKVRNEFNIPDDAYVIGHLGRITPWKGQRSLLMAFIKYSKQNPDAYLLLVGASLFNNDRYYKYLRNTINKYHLNNRVIMPGYRNDIKEIYSAMDLFLYPALEKDTSPLALISAISSGLPVAFSNIGSLFELTILCPEIDTFDPQSRDEIIFIMKKYENTNTRIYKGNLNKKSGIIYFDISTHGMNMVQIFNNVFAKSQ